MKQKQDNSNTTTTTDLFYTYILELSNNTYYTGITNNIEKRKAQHDKGQSKSTKRHLPVKLIYTCTNTTRKAARRLEVKIKNMGAAKYLNKLQFAEPG